MRRLEVQVSRMPAVMIGLLGLIMLPLALAAVFMGLSDGIKVVPLGIGSMMLAAFLFVVWISRRAQGRSVQSFSESGLVRFDGTRFQWSDLEEVIHQYRVTSLAHQTKQQWRTEIRFRNGGAAWLLPMRISNYAEVERLVRELPCKHTETRVGGVV